MRLKTIILSLWLFYRNASCTISTITGQAHFYERVCFLAEHHLHRRHDHHDHRQHHQHGRAARLGTLSHVCLSQICPRGIKILNYLKLIFCPISKQHYCWPCSSILASLSQISPSVPLNFKPWYRLVALHPTLSHWGESSSGCLSGSTEQTKGFLKEALHQRLSGLLSSGARGNSRLNLFSGSKDENCQRAT